MKKLFTLCLILLSYSMTMAQETCNNYWPVFSPDGNHIYFSSDRHGGDYEIYKVDIDGTSNLKQLTNSGVNKLYAAVSPDGSLIAFQKGNYGATAEIYIMNSDGTNLVQLTDNSGHDGFPNFSPDGSKIVFEAWDGSTYPEIFTMNIDGSERTQITNESGAFWQSAPQYNPSGTKIFMSAGFNADNHYVMMDLDGSNWVNITEPNEFGDSEWGLSFFNDGSKILFYTTQYVGYNNGCDFIIANVDGSNWNKITNSTNGEYFYGGVVHPTNEKIYFSYYPGGSGKMSLNTMSEDGSNIVRISTCSQLGIDEETPVAEQLISPNPANEMININLKKDFSLYIYDLTGKLVFFSKETSINISALARGIYTIVLKDPDNQLIKTEKLIKN